MLFLNLAFIYLKQKLKSLMTMEKKLTDEIDEIDELINLRDKKIEQLKAEIQRDLAK